jgi:hypothetical protein
MKNTGPLTVKRTSLLEKRFDYRALAPARAARRAELPVQDLLLSLTAVRLCGRLFFRAVAAA